MKDSFLSKKFMCLSFFAMVSVVLIHSIAILTTKDPSKWNAFVQYLVFRSFTYWAVPFFFACSGFWFASGSYMTGDLRGGNRISVWMFWLKKVRTLLVPYLFWVVVAAAIIMPLTMGNNLLMHRGLFERTFLADIGILGKLDCLMGITRAGPLDNGPLWYVRSLLLLFAAAPVWRMVARMSCGWMVLLTIWLVETFLCPIGFDLIHLGAGAVGWFAFGIVVALRKWATVRLPKSLVWVAMLVWMFAAITKAFHMAGVECFVGLYEHAILLIPHGGILFMWGVYDYIGLSHVDLKTWMKETFWIFCFHQIPTAYFIATGLYVFGKGDLSTLLVGMANVAFVLTTSALSISLCKRFFPVLAELLTENRCVRNELVKRKVAA